MSAEDRLFGELLGRLVPLSNHDVCEILEEQSGSRRRFGQIALSWGLCEAEHVWQVWAAQLNGRTPRIDLLTTGIDTQATLQLPAALAARLGVIPVRSISGRLIVAASEAGLSRAAEGLARADLPQKVCFVLSDHRQIEQAIQTYYGQWLEVNGGRACAGKCRGAACDRPNRQALTAAQSPRPCAASSPGAELAAAAFVRATPPRPPLLRAPERSAV
jgi:hypothetical protein